MTEKHNQPFNQWRREGERFIHESGLVVAYDEDTGSWASEEGSTEVWTARELGQGTPIADLVKRLHQLCREAAEFAKTQDTNTAP